MFKAIKEFFAGKKADAAAEPTAPYKVEPPAVAAAGNETLSNNTAAAAPAPKKSPAPRSRKPSGSGKSRAKKPAAKKPAPTP
jgi:hypothetical protein